MAFLTLVFAFSQDVPPSRSSGGFAAAGVLLDQIEALDRHEQLVVAVIAELEELLDDVAAADGDLLQADELADAVIDVDDEIADLEIAQVGEERGGRRSLLAGAGRAALFLEDVGLGVDLQGLRLGTWVLGLLAGTRRRKPFDSQPSATSTAPRHVAGVRRHHRADVVVPQQFNGALGAAVRAGDEHDVIAVRPAPP